MKEEHFNLQEQLSEGLELKNWLLREGLKKVEVEVEVEVEVKFSKQGEGGGFSEGHFPLHFSNLFFLLAYNLF